MAERSGFSLASVLLSYFLIAGGIAIGLILLVVMKTGSEALFYASLALGGGIGGFAAGRASRGTTITEPAIGGVLVVLTMVGVFVGTDVGALLWKLAKSDITRMVLIAGAAAAAGAIGGAVVGEKMGTHSQSSIVWLAHVTLAVLGAMFVALLVVMAMLVRGEDQDVAAGAFFGAMGVGALLAGLAAGASAPKRILLMSWLGTVIGSVGFFLLITALPGAGDKDNQSDAALGFVIIGIGAGVLTLLGALVGWKTVGEKAANTGAAAAAFS